MTKTNPIINWSQAPSDTAVWCAALQLDVKHCEGWHEKLPNGDYLPVGPHHTNLAPWIKFNENVLFEVHSRPGPWYETGDLPPVGERVMMVGPDLSGWATPPNDSERWEHHVGKEVTIVAHSESPSTKRPIAVYECRISNYSREGYDYHAMVANCFKPLPTEEEKAAAAKKAFVREAHAICLAGGSWGLEHMLQRMYDAGYRSPDDNRKQEDAQ